MVARMLGIACRDMWNSKFYQCLHRAAQVAEKEIGESDEEESEVEELDVDLVEKARVGLLRRTHPTPSSCVAVLRLSCEACRKQLSSTLSMQHALGAPSCCVADRGDRSG